MKKVGLLSVYNHNYGSILQAYAMQTVLRNAGNQVEILLYKKTDLVKQEKAFVFSTFGSNRKNEMENTLLQSIPEKNISHSASQP